MCGIAGAVVWAGGQQIYDENRLRKMSAPLRFRGPDAEGYYLQTHQNIQIAFAHKRLSIIDLSEGGAQPMHSTSRQSSIVFNGEIYNYRALKQQLEAEGCRFVSHSDTEVILEGFERWGIEKLLDALDGMFAFSLYCRRSSQLFLARDRFGKKPLYYYAADQHLAFSSDIRSFAALNLPNTLDMQALGYYFAELATPKTNTIWQEIKRLAPAHYLVANANGISIKRYWSMPYEATCQLSTADIIEKTDALLKAAVAKRLVADVNVAAQLSGGIDSSLVVAIMAGLNEKPVSTYSVGFEHKYYNETPFARQVAERYKTNHHELMMRPEDIGVSHDLILEYGEPFADVSMIPSYLISKYISQTEKVVCGGDGGDELFSGYHSYYVVDKMAKLKNFSFLAPLAKLAAKVMPTYRTKFLADLLRLAKQPEWTLLNRNMGFSAEQMRQLAPDIAPMHTALEQEHSALWATYKDSPAPLLKKVLHASLDTRLLNDYLVKVDRAAMYASLEMRSPFLDRHLAEFAFTLSPQQLMSPHGNKSILKTLSERYLPHNLIYRNKQGFGVPIDDWFRKELRPAFEQLVLQGKQTLVPLNYDYIGKLLQRHADGEDHTHRLWTLYVFHCWANSVVGSK